MKSTLLILLIIAAAIWMLPTRTDFSDVRKYKTYSQHFSNGLRYGLFKPEMMDAAQRYPLVVYLHGSRDTVSRDLNWYQPAFQTANPSFVLTPKCDVADQGWGNTWTAAHTPAAAKTLALIDSLSGVYPIDKDRIYLYGISMGGFGTFSMVSKEKGKFAAAYAICGGSDTEAAASLLDTPLWIFHGDADNIVPVRLSRDVYKEMIRLGGKKVCYTEYPGVKHNSWENASKEARLPVWLFAQRRGAEGPGCGDQPR